MERANAPVPASVLLPLGTVVGAWRVEAWRGGGVYGAVYRAVRVGQEEAGPVALKVGVWPGDPRFAREVALLTRVPPPQHSSPVGRGDVSSRGSSACGVVGGMPGHHVQVVRPGRAAAHPGV
jgi:eukaryotic-like serine/threonine-protein kinase